MIEKGVQIPPKHSTRIRRGRYPFEEMQVGDSFLANPSDSRNAVGRLATYYRRKTGHKFIVRKVEVGIRVWRTA